MSGSQYISPNETVTEVANNSEYGYFRWNENIPPFVLKELPIAYSIVGIVLNIILITYFIKSGKYKIPTFTLLTSLAFLDVISCIAACGFAGLLFPVMTVPGSGFACTLFFFLAFISIVASEYNLVFFAALRLYQLAFPLFARARLTCSFVFKGCLIIQLLTLIYSIGNSVYFVSDVVMYNGKEEMVCTFSGNAYAQDLSVDVVCAWIPCGSIFILHFSKYIALARSNDKLFVQTERKNADARAVTIVIVLFFIAYFAPNTYALITHATVENYDPQNDNLYILLLYLTFSNSTINPLIYCFAAKSVRDDVLKLICGKRRMISQTGVRTEQQRLANNVPT